MIGACLAFGSIAWAGRLVWEMTMLTWRDGPQMIGFSLAHTIPLVFILGSLSMTGAMVWCIWVGGALVLRRRRLSKSDWIILLGASASVIAVSIPYTAWQWATMRVLGEPR